MTKTFFDEETVEKVREHDKEEIVLNRKKSNFNKINRAAESYNTYNYGNEELLNSYIGPKYKKFMTKNFNWCAFFLGPFYYLYRKMYIYGFGLTLFNSIVNTYFIQNDYLNINNITMEHILTVFAFDVVLRLILGMSFNKLYVGNCINDINRLKQDYPTMDTNELCKNKGGTSLALAIIADVVITILVRIIMRFL